MLTSCKLTGAAGAISAYHSKEENYYFSQGAGLGAAPASDTPEHGHIRVHGELCPVLGLQAGGTISEAAFTHLLEGKDAAGNHVTRQHNVRGIDLVFSAPKSVSVAALITERDPRIIEAHDRAVVETMRELEKHSAYAHPTPDTSFNTGSMAYVTVRDGFNRDHDPHLHTHVVVMNMTKYEDCILALYGRRIMTRDFNKVWGALYRTNLAAKLKELGYAVSYTKKGELRLDAVSLEVEREFSGRRAQIQAKKEMGARDMEAWRETRKDKDPQIVKADVLAGWRDRVARHQQKTVEENRHDVVLNREQWFKEAQWSVEARQELAGERLQTEAGRWQVAARRATEHQARASGHAVITEYLTELARTETWNPITYTEAEQRLNEQVNSGNLLATDDGCFTTWELARADRECVESHEKAAAGLAMGRTAAAGKVAAYREAERSAGRRGLSGPQAEAAAAILSAASGTVVVQGDAGAGKTTMLKAVNDLAAAQGWEVAGVAVQGVAARKLEDESGIESTTLASYLARERAADRAQQAAAAPANAAAGALAPRGPRLVVVDEASMLGSRDLAALLRTAEEHGDKVVLVGDRNQIQSVGAGKPFERLVAAAKQSGQLLSLTENYRQRDAQLRQAVDLARNGHMRQSLDLLNENHKIQEIEDVAQRRAAVAKLYNKDTLIVTGSRQSREELNLLIRKELAAKGELAGGRAYNLTWADEDGVKQSVKRELAAGERVVFLQNEYKDYDVRNGEVGTVTKTGKNTLGVRLEDGREVELDLARYGALDYGYALTTYKSQGQTYDKVVVEADTSTPQLQDQRNTYVQITRAREDVRIITDDFFELRDVAGVLSVKQDTHDPDLSLREAKEMESQVRENVLLAERQALALRAQQEASAKAAQVPPRTAAAGREEICPAGTSGTSDTAGEDALDKAKRDREDYQRDLEAAWSKAAAERLRRGEALPRGLPRGAAPEPAEEANAQPFSSEICVYNQALVDSSADKAACFLQFEQLEERLRQRQDLSEAEKRRVVGQLSRRESIHNLEVHLPSPDKTIAAALVASGARDFDGAAKGLSDHDKAGLRRFLDDEQRRNESRAVGQKAQPLDLAATKAAPGPVHINTESLSKAADGDADFEKALLQKSASLEARLNERKDLDAGVKHRVAEYFGRPEAVKVLIWPSMSTDARIAAAEVISGTRNCDEACRGLRDDEMRTVYYLAQSAIDQSKDREAAERTVPFGSEELLPSTWGEAPGDASKRAEAANIYGAAADIKRQLAADAAKTHEAAVKAARELAKARTEEKDARQAEDAAFARHNAAISPLRRAEEWVRKAPFWEKAAARAAEKDAEQQLAATSERYKETKVTAREARQRLEAAEERSREAETRAAKAARLDNFQGPPEAVVKAAEAVLEVQEASRKLTVAQTAEKAAQQGLDDARSRCNEVDRAWYRARDRVSEARDRVRTAHLWEKKEARAAEQEAQRDRDAVEKRMGEVKLARDEALAREQASRDPVKAAEATLATAQARAAKAARINDFQAAQEALRARADLVPAEQHRVAEYLGRSANASIIRDCDNPQQAIAAGLIASGTRDAKEATKGMEKPDAAKVVEAVEHNREIEKERRREQELSRDRGRDRGFYLER